MRCTRLAQKAAASVEKLRGKTAVVDLDCAVLGLPKPAAVPPDGGEHVAGLQLGDGVRDDRSYVLGESVARAEELGDCVG